MVKTILYLIVGVSIFTLLFTLSALIATASVQGGIAYPVFPYIEEVDIGGGDTNVNIFTGIGDCFDVYWSNNAGTSLTNSDRWLSTANGGTWDSTNFAFMPAIYYGDKRLYFVKDSDCDTVAEYSASTMYVIRDRAEFWIYNDGIYPGGINCSGFMEQACNEDWPISGGGEGTPTYVMMSSMPGTTTCTHTTTSSSCVGLQSDVLATNDFGLSIGFAYLVGLVVLIFITYVFNTRKL